MMQTCDGITFFRHLLSRCPTPSDLRLTLTALHPDGQHPTPSRHAPLTNTPVLQEALERLERANRCGWGAFFGVGLRKSGLGRYRRGGVADVVLLPAVFVDIDDPTAAVLQRLQRTQPRPSCIVSSGGGYHAYWWLEDPTADLKQAGQVLRGLASAFGGDPLSVAQSLRLPGTWNTKPDRNRALCHVIEITDRCYSLTHFQSFLPATPDPPIRQRLTSRRVQGIGPRAINPALTAAIITVLQRDYEARLPHHGNWIAALCPYGHAQDRPGSHFFFNPSIGCGCCHGRHGTRRLTDLCLTLGIDAALYGGVYRSEAQRALAT